jgi:hypothetical protein
MHPNIINLRSNKSPYRAVNTFHLGYQNKSVYAVRRTSSYSFIQSNSLYRAVNTFHLGYKTNQFML